jgi:hypothetical protein
MARNTARAHCEETIAVANTSGTIPFLAIFAKSPLSLLINEVTAAKNTDF